MKATHLSLCLLVGTILSACTNPATDPGTEQPTFSTAAIKAKLDSMNVNYHDRFRDSTTTFFAALYTADACVMAPNMPRICGIDGITKFYWYDGNSQTTTLDIKGEEVSGTASEVTEVGTYRVIDDEGTQLDAGKFIAIYRNDGGVWKVHREIWNSDVAVDAPSDSTAVSPG